MVEIYVRVEIRVQILENQIRNGNIIILVFVNDAKFLENRQISVISNTSLDFIISINNSILTVIDIE